MSQLEFKYAADQQYQLDASNAVCNLFRGQEFLKSRFTVSGGSSIPEYEQLEISGCVRP